MMVAASFEMYRILRYMCRLHGIPDHGVARSTLHAWKARGVSDALIESLSLRLVAGSALSFDAIHDLALGVGYSFPIELPRS